MWRSLGIWLIIAVSGILLLGWNGSRFLHTRQQPRMKDLTFLPPPVVAQALSLGQGTAMSKLRWIDSFAYFQYQVDHDRRDDRVAGEDGRGGCVRLYETLIALDPEFLPFYEHAVLNTSGVVQDHTSALALVSLGILHLPAETELWRIASAELAIQFDWQSKQRVLFDAYLRAWSDQAGDAAARQEILNWRRGLAMRNVACLDTLPWWIEQLRSTREGEANAIFVETTIRDLLARHSESELPKMLVHDGVIPEDGRLNPQGVRACYPRGLPNLGGLNLTSVIDSPDGPRLRQDPFGWPFRCEGGKVISPGLRHRRFQLENFNLRAQVAAEAARRGRPPHDAGEAEAWAKSPLPPPPDGGRWSFDEQTPEIVFPDPPGQPWPLRPSARSATHP